VGQVVQKAEGENVALTQLSLAQLQAIDKRFEEDVVEVFSITAVLANRTSTGGTAPAALLSPFTVHRLPVTKQVIHLYQQLLTGNRFC
jgi:argininosuccinate lyase